MLDEAEFKATLQRKTPRRPRKTSMPRNPYYSGPVTDHFDGTRFYIKNISRDKTFGDILRWGFGGGKHVWPKHEPAFETHPEPRLEAAQLRVTSIGHASFLIQTGGLNILIDPVWAERASPFTFAGPKRVNAPGVRLENLPPLDAILVSHNHYDHMDMATLNELVQHRSCRILTPLGNDTIIRASIPNARIESFDWGARVEIGNGIAVHFLPSYHWSSRWVNDKRMALWAAFLIETSHGNIYHIADTAYGNGAIFKEVREIFGPLRLAIIPIGAYEPRWFMRDQHVEPFESVQIFEDCGAAYALAHHWGTFQLTHEPIWEPPQKLSEALTSRGIDHARFVTRRPGEVFDVPEL